MGQVPNISYLAIGGGRATRHFTHYLSLKSIPYEIWTRAESIDRLYEKASRASHILVLINDDAIVPFLKEHPRLSEGSRALVHFSGRLTTPLAIGAHPLMTFPERHLYDLAVYESIPFIVDQRERPFSEILPKLSNSHYALAPAQKPLYHALCAMAGNFTGLLWEKLFSDFETRLGIPRAAALPYLQAISANLISAEGKSVLTGPLARGDQSTVESHLSALKNDPYERVYRAFVEAFIETRGES
jgi:hypothetical protein